MIIFLILTFLFIRVGIANYLEEKRLLDIYNKLVNKGYSGNIVADLDEIDEAFDSIPHMGVMIFDIRKWTYKQWFGEEK